MPSATANKRPISRALSWLSERTRPTSVATPERTRVTTWSPRDLEHRLTDLNQVPLGELGDPGQPLGVHERSVRRTKVFHVEMIVTPVDPRVLHRRVGVPGGGQSTAGGPAD